MSWYPHMGPAGPDQPPKPKHPDLDVESNLDENDHLVMEAEQFVLSTFRDWVKQSGLHESRERDVLNAPTDQPKSLLLGNERNRVLRVANKALGDYGTI